MSDFWSTARQAAAAEFGRRHWRVYATFAWAKRLAPLLAGLVVAAGLIAAGYYLTATWVTWSPWIPTIVVGLAVAGGAGLLLAFATWLWRNRWRWSMPRPVRLRWWRSW